MADSPSAPLVIRLFGPCEVLFYGQPLPRLRSRKGLWLLALLTLRSGGDTDRAWLAGTLWPDSTEAAAFANLRSTLKDLRRALGPEAARLHAPDDTPRGAPRALRLDLEGVEVDVLAFDAAIAAGDTASLERAVELYRGPLLEECAEVWALPEREAREQGFLRALEQLAGQALDRGDVATAEGHLRRAVAVDPLRESAQRALMRALAVAGNGAAVMEVYRELRLRLHRELNIAPDPETVALFEELRSGSQLGTKGSQREKASVLTPGGRQTPSSGCEPPATSDERPEGTVTFLFTDIEGSTRLWEQHPEATREALARHDALAAAVIQQHAGTLLKSRGEGDSLFAVFARASDALAAAHALQRAFVYEPWPTLTPLRVRIALHTGEAELREGDYFGAAVNRAARLRAAAQGGQVLLSLPTEQLVRDSLPEGISLKALGACRLRDLARPESIFQLVHPDLPGDFPPLRSLDTLPNNLPQQVTSFIGREREIAEVKRLMESARLLTLTGAGGTGKTRLALQVAAELLEGEGDGVWLVELAALSDPELVPQAVAGAVGVREEAGRPLTQTLVEALKPRRMLLVLDNCEHLLGSCAALADALLRGCPEVHLLATSREGLNIPGETPYRLRSLSLPDLPGSAGMTTLRAVPPASVRPASEASALPDTLLHSEAVRLFIDRATTVAPSFTVTTQNAAAVVQVCQRLDGIPLAIELAAARVKALSVEKLNERLDDMFRLLTGGSRTALPRHQTLRALIDWSHDLLSPSEQALLRRLSVFAGGWTLEAAEGVCSGVQVFRSSGVQDDSSSPSPEHPNTRTLEHPEVEEWEVLDLLTSLVEKSLVLYEEREGEGRYRLLETVRQYGRDRLRESGEEAAVRWRHCDWFLALAEEAEPKIKSSEQGRWLERLEREHDNVRTALAWCQTPALSIGPGTRGAPSARTEGGESSDETSLRLAGAMSWFWFVRSYLSEGRRWVEGALAQAEEAQLRSGAPGRTAARAKALYGAGMLAWDNNDLKAARSLLEESAAMARELGEKRALAYPLGWLGMVLGAWDDHAGALSAASESVALFREVGDRWGLAVSLFVLGHIQLQDHRAVARSLFEESTTLLREVGDKWGLALSLGGLGNVAYRQGDLRAARALWEEGLALRREVGHKFSIALTLHWLGDWARREGDYERATALFEEALAIQREIGNKQHASSPLTSLGHVARDQGNFEAARARYEESLAIHRELANKPGIADSLLELASVAHAQGDDEKARALLEEAQTLEWEGGNTCLFQGHLLLELGDYTAARCRYEEGLALYRLPESIAIALLGAGHAAWLQGEHGVTQSNAVEALGLFKELGDRDWLFSALESLAVVALAQGREERAARLLGAVEALREAWGLREPDRWRRPREQIEEAARAACLQEAFAAAWAEGRAMALEEAIQHALEC